MPQQDQTTEGISMALMDAAERKKFLDTLRQDDDFRADVRREVLTDELVNLPQSVAALIDHGAQVQRDLGALVGTTRQLIEINQNLAVDVRQGFGAVQERLTEMDVRFDQVESDMRGGFVAVDARFDQVDAEIRDLKSPPAA